MKIVFFGSSTYVLPIIETLNPTLVATTEGKPYQPVPAFCKEHNIPCITVEQWNKETIDQLQNVHALVGILASFGLIVPPHILSLFPKGILNIHPSLLPKYRGSLPVQEALFNGDKTTGISIIKLDNDMDHGPILVQEEIAFLPNETADAAYYRFFRRGAEIIKEVLPEYTADKKHVIQQNHAEATYTKRHLSRKDGYFDITNPPSADQLHRMIRAYYPWPGVWTRLSIKGQEKVLKLLPENRLHVEGKKPMSFKDFYNGYPQLKETIENLF